MMCSTLNKNKKKCSKAGCNWVEDDQDTCQSCNKGANRLECNEMSCVWEGNIKNIGKMCTPCTAIKDASKKTCKKAGCAFKKKCVSCLTKPNKKKCKKNRKGVLGVVPSVLWIYLLYRIHCKKFQMKVCISLIAENIIRSRWLIEWITMLSKL